MKTRVVVTGMVEGMKRLGDAKESIARTMGVAMGTEVRDEARVRAPVLQPGNKGTDGQTPGELRDSIYLAYDDKRQALSRGTSYRYVVSWNSKRAPHGHLLEFGHWMPYLYDKTDAGLFYTPLPPVANPAGGTDGFYVAAHPFLGPAFDAKFNTLQSIATMAGEKRFKEIFG